MNSTVVYLPFNTTVMVRAFSNATFLQQVTVAPETGNSLVWTGSGENCTPLGNSSLRTPAQGQNPRGYQATVTINTKTDQGWQPSSVAQGMCGVMYFNLVMVVSEDFVDQDWNDAVVTFTWWAPPSVRSLEDFEIVARQSQPGAAPPDHGSRG